MADSRIGILMEARDQASNQIKSVNQALGGINDAAGIAAGGLGGLATAIGAVAAVELGKQAFELAKVAAGALEAKGSFDDLAATIGNTGDEMLATLQKASAGLVTNTDLVLSANKAMLLGVADSADQMAQLLEVARVRSDAMGQSVGDTFNQIVEGIGRMSSRMLVGVAGLQDEQQLFEQYAASVGKTATQLTDAEKKQVLFNAVVNESAGLVARSAGSAESAADKFDRMEVSIDNARVSLGELLLAMGLPEAVDTFTRSIDESRQQIEAFIGAIDAVKNKVAELSTIDAQNVLSDVGPQLTAAAAEFNKALNDIQNAAITGGAAAGNLSPLSARLGELGDQLQSLAADYNKAAAVTGAPLIDVTQLRAGIVAFQNTSSALDETSRGLDKVAVAGPHAASGIEEASTAALGGARNMLAAARAAFALAQEFTNAGTALGASRLVSDLATNAASDASLDKIRQAREEAAKFTNASTDAGRAILQQGLAVQETNNAIEAHNKALKDDTHTVSEAEKAFDSLKSKVAGVLSGALNVGVGVDVDSLLPREDAVNENARRLADIAVNGFKGQDWLGKFKEAVPDIFTVLETSGDPKATAARILKDFQDGLEPELIDKEKAKELVRRMILGEQKADQLAQEIAQELSAEFGAAAPANINELVGQALGTGAKGQGAQGGAQAGADAANSFAASFVSAASTVGGQIAAALKADSVIALIKDAGKIAGQNWGDMFLSAVGDHVPDSLISLLTDLVTPGVQARLATQTSLTGAK